MNTWFTSDFHFGHANIIKYCGRPFKDVGHMDSVIVKRHNERVKPDDTVYFLGDFCFRNTKGGKEGEGTLTRAEYYQSLLNGHFVFIRGNHDNNNSLNTKIKHLVLEMGGKDIFLVHDPAEFNPKYDLNIVGHVHRNWKTEKRDRSTLVNVGVDVWNFYPVSFQEILAAAVEAEVVK